MLVGLDHLGERVALLNDLQLFGAEVLIQVEETVAVTQPGELIGQDAREQGAHV